MFPSCGPQGLPHRLLLSSPSAPLPSWPPAQVMASGNHLSQSPHLSLRPALPMTLPPQQAHHPPVTGSSVSKGHLSKIKLLSPAPPLLQSSSSWLMTPLYSRCGVHRCLFSPTWASHHHLSPGSCHSLPAGFYSSPPHGHQRDPVTHQCAHFSTPGWVAQSKTKVFMGFMKTYGPGPCQCLPPPLSLSPFILPVTQTCLRAFALTM